MLSNIFIHFLDREVLELFGFLGQALEGSYAYRELRLATRLAFLICSNRVIVPASNYIESPFARQILDEIREFGLFGYLALASSSLNFGEFSEKKRTQYAPNPNLVPSYFGIMETNPFVLRPAMWLPRTRRATEDIAEVWQDSIGDSNTWEPLYKLSSCDNVWGFECALAKVPERLGGAAFIPDFVISLPPWEGQASLEMKNKINVIITRAYIKSFLDEFDAVCLTAFSFFDTSLILPQDRAHISLKLVKRILHQRNLLMPISTASGRDLLDMKLSTSWADVVETVLQPAIAVQENVIDSIETPTKRLPPKASPATKAGREKTMDIRCFIVHGHDNLAMLELKNYLQNTLKLPEPVVLHEQPSQGRAIIEKFEDYAAKANLVFVLLTPDDKVGSLIGSDEEKRRARQNVIFELGYFLALLKRHSGRVLLLYKGDVELPSDIIGVVHIDISHGVEAAGEIIRREIHDLLCVKSGL